jgi:porin
MKTSMRLAVLLATMMGSSALLASPAAIPETWGGDLASRPRLTGDWGGLRDDMAKKGVTLDLDVYWMPQWITSGGRKTDNGDWGNAVVALNIDTHKAGLWQGGHFKLQTVSSFGDNLIQEAGALVPPNISWMLPSIKHETGLQELTYTQFLAPNFAMVIGKINTIAPTNQFHGDYRSGFQNASMNLPLAMAMVPLSAYGLGAVYVPSKEVTLAGMLLDPSGTIMDDEIGDAFDDGVMALLNADLKVKPFGLPGHQNLTLAWSNKNHPSLIQDPTNIARHLLRARFPLLSNPGPILTEILERRAPGLLIPAQPMNEESKTWAAVYSFEQYVWKPDADSNRGVGAFFSFGASDGKANPIKYSYSVGVNGKGIVPGRPHDELGLGWSRAEFSDNFVPFMRDTFGLGLDKEDALEAYYNFAVTPWLSVTPSYQYISPALNKTMSADGSFKKLDNTQIVGVRVGIRF